MPTPLSLSLDFLYPAGQVTAVLKNPEFLAHKVDVAQGTLELTQTEDATSMVVTRSFELPEGTPDLVKSMAGAVLKITEIQTWKFSDEEHHVADLHISAKDGLATLVGTVTVEPRDAGSVVLVSGTATVNIPFMGGKLEKLITDYATSVITEEHSLALHWLATHGA